MDSGRGRRAGGNRGRSSRNGDITQRRHVPVRKRHHSLFVLSCLVVKLYRLNWVFGCFVDLVSFLLMISVLQTLVLAYELLNLTCMASECRNM